jgi:hypothetical protein
MDFNENPIDSYSIWIKAKAFLIVIHYNNGFHSISLYSNVIIPMHSCMIWICMQFNIFYLDGFICDLNVLLKFGIFLFLIMQVLFLIKNLLLL